eukprot:TRINITY_DN4431_c0_g1_i3.p1 TRINITY_DN4431_c0_g1~~TRINITY_DN4431_c0_g1_i3.p1  ORF type:complete len:166 (+),score=49.49 TRINITY_DN4431_c0_g1_i3:169-666(+)
MQHVFSSSFVIYTILLAASFLLSVIHAQILVPGDVGSDEIEAKRSWNEFQGGYGKRAWNHFAGGYGKRSNPEDGLSESDILLLNEKRAWNSGFAGGMGKRAWNSGFAGGMGKRAWNNGFTGGMGKRAWNSGYAGGMGKRAWNSGYAGGMGKRSMEDDLASERSRA